MLGGPLRPPSLDYSSDPPRGTEVENFHISAGWGTARLQGRSDRRQDVAELNVTGRTPELIELFALERFYEAALVSELAAAAVSH